MKLSLHFNPRHTLHNITDVLVKLNLNSNINQPLELSQADTNLNIIFPYNYQLNPKLNSAKLYLFLNKIIFYSLTCQYQMIFNVIQNLQIFQWNYF